MPAAFLQTTRSLNQDAAWPALLAWGGAALGLALWSAWFLLGRVAVVEVSQQARVEVRQAAHALSAPAAGTVLRTALVLGQAVQAGQVLVELDADTDRLRLTEARARQQALQLGLGTLERELAALGEAASQGAQAATAAVQAARLRSQEAAAALAHAADLARRLREESAVGAVPQVEAQQAQAEARKLAAARDAQLADALRLQADHAGHAADQQAALQALRRQRALLQGEIATGQATLNRLQVEVGRHQLRAPVAGVVGDIAPLRAGDVVLAGQKFATIVPAGELIVAADFDPAAALGRLQPGQTALMRLDGFPWAQHGTVSATVSRVATEVRDGHVRVELTPQPAAAGGPRLQHGLPGAVEVAVERVSPALLLLRTMGQAVHHSAVPAP